MIVLVRYILRRLLTGALVVLGVATATFILVRLVANPVALLAGRNQTPETIAVLTRRLGLDRPIWEQYGIYLQDLLGGDLGVSRRTYQPVLLEIGNRLPATVELLIAALLIALLVSIPLAWLAASRPRGFFDRLSQFSVQAGSSLPSFWVGLLLIFVFYAELHLLPAPLGRLESSISPPPRFTGLMVIDGLLAGDLRATQSAVAQLTLPATTLALAILPTLLQILRMSMLQILSSDYMRSARALGLARGVQFRYAVKNAMVPFVNAVAMTAGYAISGAVLIEVVFSWPGIGFYAVTAMSNADYAPVVGVVIVSAAAYVALYVIADLVSAAVDPRIPLR